MKRIKQLLHRRKSPESSDPSDSNKHAGKDTVGNISSNHEHMHHVATPQAAPDAQAPYQEFQYKPLKSPRHFRILRLKRQTSDECNGIVLRGSLIEASLDAPPTYTALSYTWGNPNLCESLLIDQMILKITANCNYALKRMLKGKRALDIFGLIRYASIKLAMRRLFRRGVDKSR